LWLDNIRRDLLDSGKLKRHIDEFSVTGLTSNPTIFDNAITRNSWYDMQIRKQLDAGATERGREAPTSRTMARISTRPRWIWTRRWRNTVASANIPGVTKFGIDPGNTFGFWD
jgi:transaldolase